MKFEEFMEIYRDMSEQGKLKATNYFYLHCNLFKGQGLTRLKVDISSITFLMSDPTSPAKVIRFVPVGESISATDFKSGCMVYMPLEQIICISDDERADGFKAEDIIKHNTAVLAAFNEKQRLILEGATTEELSQLSADSSDHTTNTTSSDPDVPKTQEHTSQSDVNTASDDEAGITDFNAALTDSDSFDDEPEDEEEGPDYEVFDEPEDE